MVGEAKPLRSGEQLSVLSLSKSVAHFALGTLWLSVGRRRKVTPAFRMGARGRAPATEHPPVSCGASGPVGPPGRNAGLGSGARTAPPERAAGALGSGRYLERVERYEGALQAYDRPIELAAERLDSELPVRSTRSGSES
jgi:hypothetical protein